MYFMIIGCWMFLLASTQRNCFLLDRNLEPGEEPVKLCVRDGQLVEFRKQARASCDYCGESVGFFRLTPDIVARLVRVMAEYMRAGRTEQPHEEALRDVLLADPQAFGTDSWWNFANKREQAAIIAENR